MSQAQEAFFAKALKSVYPSTTNNGRTGEPDILIPELNKELECKLTSRQKSGSIAFQSDYETLQKKGSLDYLYVVASEDFDEFVVVHYAGLTVEDFRPLSNGARGKVPQSAAPQLIELIHGFPRQALHAWRLCFEHPVTSAEVDIEAPWPEDFTKLVEGLQSDV